MSFQTVPFPVNREKDKLSTHCLDVGGACRVCVGRCVGRTARSPARGAAVACPDMATPITATYTCFRLVVWTYVMGTPQVAAAAARGLCFAYRHFGRGAHTHTPLPPKRAKCDCSWEHPPSAGRTGRTVGWRYQCVPPPSVKSRRSRAGVAGDALCTFVFGHFVILS